MFDEDWLNGSHSEFKRGAYRWLNSDGNRHRTDGPAFVRPGTYAVWYVDGIRHRVDGPAVVWADGTQKWYLWGVKVSQDQFERFRKLPETVREHVKGLLLCGVCFGPAIEEVSAAA